MIPAYQPADGEPVRYKRDSLRLAGGSHHCQISRTATGAGTDKRPEACFQHDDER